MRYSIRESSSRRNLATLERSEPEGTEWEVRIKRQGELDTGGLSLLSHGCRRLERRSLGRQTQCARFPAGHQPPLPSSTECSQNVSSGRLPDLHVRAAGRSKPTPRHLRVPFYHRNMDYDEVLFYHDGEFFSRAGIQPGMLTLHPQGIHHGPQPQAVQASKAKTHTNEVAVMIESKASIYGGARAWMRWKSRTMP